MTKVQRYSKASTWKEALAAKADDPSAAWLAGGTYLLAGDGADKPESVIDLGSALPRGFERRGEYLSIGAGATFQDIAEAASSSGAASAPRCLADAVLTMRNRNTRNRATLGGNIGADKSCSSLLPILLVLGAELEVASPASPEPERLPLELWLSEREAPPSRSTDLILGVLVPLRGGIRALYSRWNRVSCDLSVLGAAVAYSLDNACVAGLRIALGGLGPKARRRPELEALFEGRPLPSRAEIEKAAAPLLKPVADLRASAEFKRLRGSQLLADALVDAHRMDPAEARS
jgi:CO/xanthine dehydrogenase FAD-binding subunit